MISFLYSIAISSASLMLLCTNPINSVLFLILVFLSCSNIFFLMGCDFIGLIFIIVYLGAIAVLFLFIVMMINIKKIEMDSTTYFVIGVLFFIIFFFQLSYYIISMWEYDLFGNAISSKENYFFFFENKIDAFSKENYFLSLGKILYYDFFFFLVVVSMLLLLGMLGSIFLTNYKNNFSSKKQFNQFSRNNKLINVHII